MLKINKTRQTTAEFWVTEEKVEKLVKTTTINTDKNAVSTVYETLNDAELYAKYRTVMRADEETLRTVRYKIEDDILAELAAKATDKVNV
jgi:predicted NUDIX family phosphoesterase